MLGIITLMEAFDQ
jgi:hypothetical protein